MSIEIMSCPGADSRTSTSKPTFSELEENTRSHINDVQKALRMFAEKLMDAGWSHDWTKRAYMEEFYRDFSELKPGDEFKKGIWYPIHVEKERHHLLERVPDDVTLVDVFEYISDCVMAGLARSGEVWELSVPDELLQKAFTNTVSLLKDQVVVVNKEELERREKEAVKRLQDDWTERAYMEDKNDG